MNRNKLWIRNKKINKVEREATINQYKSVLELLNYFNGSISIDNLYRLLQYDYSKNGVKYIVKKLYEKGCINTFSYFRNIDNEEYFNQEEITVIALAQRANIILNNRNRTVSAPSFIKLVKDNYKVHYIVENYKNFRRHNSRRAFQTLEDDVKLLYLYDEYTKYCVKTIVGKEIDESVEEYFENQLLEEIKNKYKNDKEQLAQYYKENYAIISQSERFIGYCIEFKEYEVFKYDFVEFSVYDFIDEIVKKSTYFNDDVFIEELKKRVKVEYESITVDSQSKYFKLDNVEGKDSYNNTCETIKLLSKKNIYINRVDVKESKLVFSIDILDVYKKRYQQKELIKRSVNTINFISGLIDGNVVLEFNFRFRTNKSYDDNTKEFVNAYLKQEMRNVDFEFEEVSFDK